MSQYHQTVPIHLHALCNHQDRYVLLHEEGFQVTSAEQGLAFRAL